MQLAHTFFWFFYLYLPLSHLITQLCYADYFSFIVIMTYSDYFYCQVTDPNPVPKHCQSKFHTALLMHVFRSFLEL